LGEETIGELEELFFWHVSSQMCLMYDCSITRISLQSSPPASVEQPLSNDIHDLYYFLLRIDNLQQLTYLFKTNLPHTPNIVLRHLNEHLENILCEDFLIRLDLSSDGYQGWHQELLHFETHVLFYHNQTLVDEL